MGKKIKGSGTKDARDLAASAAEKPRKTVTKAAKTTQPATPDEKAAKAARRAAKTEKRAIKAAKKATQSGISAISDLISDLGLSALPTEVQRFLRREEQEASKSPARRLSLKTGVERLSQLLVKRDFRFQGVEALENVKALLQHGADPNYKGDLKPDNYGIIREANFSPPIVSRGTMHRRMFLEHESGYQHVCFSVVPLAIAQVPSWARQMLH